MVRRGERGLPSALALTVGGGDSSDGLISLPNSSLPTEFEDGGSTGDTSRAAKVGLWGGLYGFTSLLRPDE